MPAPVDPHQPVSALRRRYRRARRTWGELPWRRLAVGAGALCLMFALGVAMYVQERSSRTRTLTVGDAAAVDRVDVGATVHRTDPEGRTLALRVTADPRGAYADAAGAPRADLTVVSNSPGQEHLTFKAHSLSRVRDLTLALREGTSSDYPFDRYRVSLVVRATVGGTQVPLALHLRDQDPDFRLHTKAAGYAFEVAAVDSQVTRSRSTFLMAWFMAGAMWCIGLSVVVACGLVVRQRRGLVWPALGWMAASLFALVGLRNAAPGSPPNGSLLDYGAFYWAEALIAVGLTRLVFHGILLEHRKGGPIDPMPVPRPAWLRHRRVPPGTAARSRAAARARRRARP
ncbi:DUF4436 family protein [Streptomyces sp. TRM66268-LWL]|uniref:DUF4436 family protein n=1 Tax=Streptomyces polyasparticus TaxID=2767826 RepID=A0ABR7SF15_9ACTN|nr:DUF4436 family protein [Streptomyces polyasparticus]MBC9712943.1 DUF4436 family protein [Streptomyces polyasparticus]